MEYTLKDLLDAPKLQELLDSLNEVHSLPSAVIDTDGTILTATAWQDICTKFHRVNPDSEKKCIESDRNIGAELSEKTPHIIYRCPLGLVDTATPIIIEGKHLGNVFTGQLFIDPPDEAYFKEQAHTYGFDETGYLDALRRVPIFSEEQLHKNLTFIHSLATMMAEQALKQIRTLESSEGLRKSEEQHRSILQTSKDGVWVVDMHGNFLEVNESYARMSGYGVNELLSLHISDLDINETRGDVVARNENIKLHGTALFESCHRRKDGSLFDVEVNVQFQSEESGQIVAFIRDISERKKAEIDLKHSHELMSYIIRHNQSALAVHDKDMRYIYVSQRYLDDYKVKDTDIIGRHHYDVFPDLPQKWREVHKKGLAGIVSSSEEDSYERADGSVEWTRWECRPWYESTGAIGGIIIFTEVITERKRAEEHRQQLQNQLQQAQKMESIGRLAGGVAHDFNNMLSVILGYAELGLLRLDASHPVHANLVEIRKSAERSADLTRQLLAFARKQTVTPKVIDLNEAVSGMLKMLQRLIGEDVHLSWRPASHLWPVNIDTSQLDQILANLCVNARDAIADVGKIIIETENRTIEESYRISRVAVVPGNYVRLSVSDNGSGMTKETLNNIFEPFYTTKELGKGTGLGLATVYGAVKQNNGYIDVYSELGTGTTFTIYLPCYEGKVAQTHKENSIALPVKNHETILLVEDEPAILAMAKIILAEQGYAVIAANTPGEAIRLAREHGGDIHLLMTDVVMPEMNGRDLANTLLSLYPGMKRLFMSGYTADVIAHHGVLDEGVPFIQKPFNIHALAGKLREVLD